MSKRAGMRVEARSAAAGRGGDAGERVAVNLTPKASQALNEILERTQGTKTDAINRAFQMYAYFGLVLEDGGAVYVQINSDSPPQLLKIF